MRAYIGTARDVKFDETVKIRTINEADEVWSSNNVRFPLTNKLMYSYVIVREKSDFMPKLYLHPHESLTNYKSFLLINFPP